MNAEINKVRKAVIEENSSFHAALHAWNNIDAKLQNTLTESANAAVQTIFDFEPLILEDGDDQLDLKIQPDSEGESGDVRDILIIRRNIQWEIGLSIKHNHFAVKHSRLAKTLDFGEKNGLVLNVPINIGKISIPFLHTLKRRKRKDQSGVIFPIKRTMCIFLF